jgi:hypothetical protein
VRRRTFSLKALYPRHRPAYLHTLDGLPAQIAYGVKPKGQRGRSHTLYHVRNPQNAVWAAMSLSTYRKQKAAILDGLPINQRAAFATRLGHITIMVPK